ncbi:unnamed protein product [Hydatigera taeniaeformis]|uniref:Uncharacterized protein n=1 Tax=Hydatigena taeniaeformis TaxID=6205 RepID=A0A3P7FEK2_HYDTA|nr:unnamed protein product [Hydatigera taeniaeformis]
MILCSCEAVCLLDRLESGTAKISRHCISAILISLRAEITLALPLAQAGGASPQAHTPKRHAIILRIREQEEARGEEMRG